MDLLFLELQQNWIDVLKCFVNVFSLLGSSQHNFATSKDEKNDLGLQHPVDQSREDFRFITTKLLVSV